MKLNVKKSMTRGIQHELSDADYKAGAQAEIIFSFVDSVRQTGKQIVRLDGPDGNVPGDAHVESAASDHGEIGCRAGGAGSDREVRIKTVDGAQEGLSEGHISVTEYMGKARSRGEGNKRQPLSNVVYAGGGFSGKVGHEAEPAIEMKGRLHIAAVHVEAPALAGVGIASQVAVADNDFQRRHIGWCLSGR